MSVWFFICVICYFIVTFLHFKSVEHTELQQKYGVERGKNVDRIYGIISGTFEFILLIGLWASPQPLFTIPIFSNVVASIINHSIPVSSSDSFFASNSSRCLVWDRGCASNWHGIGRTSLLPDENNNYRSIFNCKASSIFWLDFSAYRNINRKKKS